MSVDN